MVIKIEIEIDTDDVCGISINGNTWHETTYDIARELLTVKDSYQLINVLSNIVMDYDEAVKENLE